MYKYLFKKKEKKKRSSIVEIKNIIESSVQAQRYRKIQILFTNLFCYVMKR